MNFSKCKNSSNEIKFVLMHSLLEWSTIAIGGASCPSFVIFFGSSEA